MTRRTKIEQFSAEECEERAAEWAATADEFRSDGTERNGGAIRFAQDRAAKWAAQAQQARR